MDTLLKPVPAADHLRRWSMSCWQRTWGILLGLVLLGFAFEARATSVSKEYQLKAAFLYNFTKFVEWPPEQFANETSPIVIAVLGANPFGNEITDLVKNRSVKGRPIIVRFIDSASEIPGAHIVFVSAGAESRLPEPFLGQPGVLTVGETSEFAARGGIIRFTLIGEKVRFEINQTSSEKAGIKLSGQLLKLATAIRKTS
jgi:hypothetical protein